MMPLGHPVRHFASVSSTMDAAAAWAEAPHGAVVVAEEQTAGRGRHGRAWAAAPGANLLFTVVLRPASQRVGLIPLAAGLAVADAVAQWGVQARLKWPNDVRVGGRKLAGVLAETTWSGAEARVLLGVGLNVAQTDFPADLAATSLRLETGQPVARLAPLSPILARLAEALDRSEADPAGLLADVEARMESIGETVTVREPSGSGALTGTVLGLAPDGALRLATDTGARAVYAGEVTLS
ncbi:biotin--[acetyl-CoA-carboxylase] ligase [Rubrivirga sp. IMCC43871]|uniref:biotin--[acetyl-CoA-carboxylase] ligase n=1 Tax=Rubrivirga sp. IMCC43871 TaxID=3391575 RepID=UPI00398FB8FD